MTLEGKTETEEQGEGEEPGCWTGSTASGLSEERQAPERLAESRQRERPRTAPVMTRHYQLGVVLSTRLLFRTGSLPHIRADKGQVNILHQYSEEGSIVGSAIYRWRVGNVGIFMSNGFCMSLFWCLFTASCTYENVTNNMIYINITLCARSADTRWQTRRKWRFKIILKWSFIYIVMTIGRWRGHGRSLLHMSNNAKTGSEEFSISCK